MSSAWVSDSRARPRSLTAKVMSLRVPSLFPEDPDLFPDPVALLFFVLQGPGEQSVSRDERPAEVVPDGGVFPEPAQLQALIRQDLSGPLDVPEVRFVVRGGENRSTGPPEVPLLLNSEPGLWRNRWRFTTGEICR
jgi:hypothetical protein